MLRPECPVRGTALWASMRHVSLHSIAYQSDLDGSHPSIVDLGPLEPRSMQTMGNPFHVGDKPATFENMILQPEPCRIDCASH